MQTKGSDNNLQNKNIIRIGVITALILLIPFLAMQFNWAVPDPGSSTSEQINWSLSDFIIMGTLIFGTGLAYELLASKVENTKQRAILALVLLTVFFLVWAELAVGVFGTPFAGS